MSSNEIAADSTAAISLFLAGTPFQMVVNMPGEKGLLMWPLTALQAGSNVAVPAKKCF